LNRPDQGIAPDALRESSPGSRSWLARCAATVPDVMAAAGVLILLVLSYAVYFETPLVVPDLSTYLLPAVAREQGTGLLYVDFLDIKPPLLFATFVPWIAIAGSSLVSMWALYALILILLFSAFYLILRQELRPWLAVFVFGSCLVTIVYFGLLEQFFFISEVIAGTAALWGLVVSRWKSTSLLCLGSAAFLLTVAGQVKDVFLFAPLALLPLLWVHRERLRAFAFGVAGVGAAVLLTLATLMWWGPGVLGAYAEVLRVKGSRFPPPDVVDLTSRAIGHAGQITQWLPWLGLFAVGVALAAIVGVRHRSWPGVQPAEWMVAIYAVSVYAGFLWQGSDLKGYFAIALIFPVFALAGVLLHLSLKAAHPLGGSGRWVITALLIVGLAPSIAALSWTAGRASTLAIPPLGHALQSAEAPNEISRYQAIHALAQAGDCLHVAYGWSATQYYLYSGLPPCNRLTLPPLASQVPELGEELQSSLLERPPDILVLDPSLAGQETEVFPYGEVADSCYQIVTEDESVLKPRGDLANATECIRDVAARWQGRS
jgi:hypothetical protein